MDIARKNVVRNRKIRNFIYSLVAIALVVSITVGLSRLKPAAPTVDRASIWVDKVKRGSMLRQVRGLGTLVPEDILFIPANTQGRVEKILVRPGAEVTKETLLIILNNPELEQAVQDVDLQVKGAKADYANLRVKLESQKLDQRAIAASVQADFNQAKLQAEANEELYKKGLLSELQYKLAKNKAEELSTRCDIEEKRIAISSESIEAQLSAQQAKIDQLQALYQLKRNQLDSLNVRAGSEGVLQQLSVEVGQQVNPGTNLARVANPNRLKAELKIAETQAKDILVGQNASIDTRNGIITGKVSRIDPAVSQGTVTVDVVLTSELPKGARPDLSVDGTIELENLIDILYVGRPVHGQANSTIGIFKLDSSGKEAYRITVKLGRSSVNTIEVLEGLSVDDQVILSDMTSWDIYSRIRLN
ncbi:MAG: efflux RND transporter periplasmic adaptor subunit [Acidobacteria bacterium]|nr:efflux RND transporter periplasmic adaptor subunit [Acidobacteriota bacterium]